jgi:hypothetical protein
MDKLVFLLKWGKRVPSRRFSGADHPGPRLSNTGAYGYMKRELDIFVTVRLQHSHAETKAALNTAPTAPA